MISVELASHLRSLEIVVPRNLNVSKGQKDVRMKKVSYM